MLDFIHMDTDMYQMALPNVWFISHDTVEIDFSLWPAHPIPVQKKPIDYCGNRI